MILQRYFPSGNSEKALSSFFRGQISGSCIRGTGRFLLHKRLGLGISRSSIARCRHLLLHRLLHRLGVGICSVGHNLGGLYGLLGHHGLLLTWLGIHHLLLLTWLSVHHGLAGLLGHHRLCADLRVSLVGVDTGGGNLVLTVHLVLLSELSLTTAINGLDNADNSDDDTDTAGNGDQDIHEYDKGHTGPSIEVIVVVGAYSLLRGTFGGESDGCIGGIRTRVV